MDEEKGGKSKSLGRKILRFEREHVALLPQGKGHGDPPTHPTRWLNYLSERSQEAKGVMYLMASCKISEIRSDTNKKKKQFVFRIVWPSEFDDGDDTGKDDGTPKKKKQQRDDKGISGGKIAAVTAGGVVVGAMTAGNVFLSSKRKKLL